MNEESKALRDAAALIRECLSDMPEWSRDCWEASPHGDVRTVNGIWVCDSDAAEYHIASFHPPVALLLAEWLDMEAEGIESGNWRPCVSPAVKFAHAYLAGPHGVTVTS
jgi:hypothetical protein